MQASVLRLTRTGNPNWIIHYLVTAGGACEVPWLHTVELTIEKALMRAPCCYSNYSKLNIYSGIFVTTRNSFEPNILDKTVSAVRVAWLLVQLEWEALYSNIGPRLSETVGCPMSCISFLFELAPFGRVLHRISRSHISLWNAKILLFHPKSGFARC